MEPLDFLAVGDTVVDEFIRLKEAWVSCDVHGEGCSISMHWGDKIPFESATLVAGVGNAANAAVSAARLGLASSLVTNIGSDRDADDIRTALEREQLDLHYMRVHEGKSSNHHYVLWFQDDRTILVKHEAYEYEVPELARSPRWLYLSSLAEHTLPYHEAWAELIAAHSESKLAFQPGTFQMQMGTDALKDIYARTEILFCNVDEARRILKSAAEAAIPALMQGLHALGPRIVVITDGVHGAYASDGARILKVPMYPDKKPPYERTGAGDAFASTVVAALALGKPLDEALLWGPINSMSVVQDIGAQRGLLSREALEALLASAPADYRISELGS